MAVVARTAGLPDVLALSVRVRADRLAVSNLRLADVGLDLVLAHHAVDDDLEVQLAHAGDDRLPGVDVRVHVEGGIFLSQLGQRHAHLLLVGLRLRLNRNLDDGLGEVNRFENDRGLLGADRIAGDQVLEPNGGADIARQNLGNLFALVGVHLQQAADAFRLAGARIQHRVTGLELARVDTDEN